MLIVMAVAVVLAAATIPGISGQIEKAKESNDLVVVADAYADAYAQAALEAAKGDYNKITATIGGLVFQQAKAGWSVVSAPKLADKAIDDTLDKTKKSLAFEFAVDEDGTLTLNLITAGDEATSKVEGEST